MAGALTVTQNALERLHDAGQSIWLDYIDRTMLHDGDLARRIRDDALTGMTSNPTMFEKALASGAAYDDQIRFEGRGVTPYESVSYTHLRAHETGRNLVCRLL